MMTPMSYTIDHVQMLQAENEKLQAQVAILRESVLYAHRQPYPFGGLELFSKALESTESDWLAQHDQQVRDEAYERAANICDTNAIEWQTDNSTLDDVAGAEMCADSIRNLK